MEMDYSVGHGEQGLLLGTHHAYIYILEGWNLCEYLSDECVNFQQDTKEPVKQLTVYIGIQGKKDDVINTCLLNLDLFLSVTFTCTLHQWHILAEFSIFPQ